MVASAIPYCVISATSNQVDGMISPLSGNKIYLGQHRTRKITSLDLTANKSYDQKTGRHQNLKILVPNSIMIQKQSKGNTAERLKNIFPCQLFSSAFL